ncbi:MAG TPA: acetylxylan esterase [Gammaproteobacteria bacterium]|nr:acetylxylan esterase [Gammaproteobacteria bacterium]
MKRICIAVTWLALGSFVNAEDSAPRPAPTTLAPPKASTLRVDARGFIHRWRVLEPIPVPGRLTESAVEDALRAAPVPAADDARWHTLDTRLYNFNLYHFAWSLSKPTSNVLFWVTTVVDSPEEMQGVRLAIGSNAASRWWLNDAPVIALNDDRQAVIDDGVSKRLTLRKGRNVIRAAIVNGGGATDFCARFLDASDQPITGLTVSLGAP